MNHGTNINLRSEANGDLTLTNDDGVITIHHDGTITLSTLAPIELAGATLGRLDNIADSTVVNHVLVGLRNRGKR